MRMLLAHPPLTLVPQVLLFVRVCPHTLSSALIRIATVKSYILLIRYSFGNGMEGGGGSLSGPSGDRTLLSAEAPGHLPQAEGKHAKDQHIEMRTKHNGHDLSTHTGIYKEQ